MNGQAARHVRGRAALTLLEVLASIVLVALIASTVTPLLLRAGSDGLRGDNSITAEAILQEVMTGSWLAARARTGTHANSGLEASSNRQPIAGHEGWFWTCTALGAPPGASRPMLISHQWLLIRVYGPTTDAQASCVLPVAGMGP